MWFQLLAFASRYRQQIIIASVVIGAFLGGRVSTPNIKSEETKIEEKITTEESKNVVTKKTTEIKEDGKVTVITEEILDKGNILIKSNTKTDSKTSYAAQYRINGGLVLPLDPLFKKEASEPDYYIGAGMRVWNPVWIETQYQFGTKEMSIGIGWEF